MGVGWDLTLLGLAQHLSTGASKEGQDIEAWSASDEGRSFFAGSSEQWCEASIGAGTDRPAATAAAARTTAFYSGEPAPDDNAVVRVNQPSRAALSVICGPRAASRPATTWPANAARAAARPSSSALRSSTSRQ